MVTRGEGWRGGIVREFGIDMYIKEELGSSDLEETAGSGSLPKRKKSFPKEEPVSDPEESGSKRVPKKKRKFSSKEEPLSSGPEEAAASKSSNSKKKKKL